MIYLTDEVLIRSGKAAIDGVMLNKNDTHNADAHKEYTALPLPQREASFKGEAGTPIQNQTPGQTGYPAPFTAADVRFAELEIDSGAAGSPAGARRAFSGETERRSILSALSAQLTPPARPQSAPAAPIALSAQSAPTAPSARPQPAPAAPIAPSVRLTPPTRPQPIGQRATDPVRQKIYDMRSLASDNPFAIKDAGLFYRQARFMEEFSDDYPVNEPLSMYYPCYQLMGYKQLRTYFTWRAKIRRGEILRTSLSYLFLYVYELLSNVGASNPADGLDKLMTLWRTFRQAEPVLDNYLPRWLKDYHIYYPLPHSFLDFVDRYHLRKFYLELLYDDAGVEDSLALWNRISAYDVTKSKFYTDGNEELFGECFYAVLRGIRSFCADRNTRFEDLLIYNTMYQGSPWYPFPRALFYPWLRQPDREVEMPGREVYSCKDNRWTTNQSMYYAGRKEVVGYLLKKTEACLRQAAEYKYKITADPSAASLSFQKLKETGITLAELNGVIEQSVTDFYRDLNRTVVVVDHDNLARIRQEALGTQNRLIVPESEAAPGSAGALYLSGLETIPSDREGPEEQGPAESLSLPGPEAIPPDREGSAEQGPAESLSTPGPEAIPLDREDSAAPDFCPPSSPGLRQIHPADPVSDGWASLYDALSDTERLALSIILGGKGGIKAFASEAGVMPEVLAESINEKAADHIGDSLLETEGDMSIYEDYREKVAEMVGLI